jgi:FtsZ-binding cell division protein ZapB
VCTFYGALFNKYFTDKIDLLQLELNSVKDILTEVRQDYKTIKNQNEALKNENDILNQKISSLETNYLKSTIQSTSNIK